MRKLLRAGVALAATALASGTFVAGLAGNAQATTTPPWETGSPPAVSPNEVGGLTFYNSSGQVITSGTISADPIAAYVQGNTALESDGTKAELGGFTPVISSPPGAWNSVPFFNSRYPNAAAPTALADSTLPLYTGVSGYSLSTLTESYPNNDTSSDGYAGLYVLRLQAYQSPNGYSTTYDSADISVNSTTGAWSLVYSPQAATTTTLATPTPSSPQTVGASVTLNATVADASAPGTVQFESDGNDVGGPVTVVDGAAQLVTTALPVGTDSLTAVFTPTTGAAFSGSTSTNPVPYTISPPTSCNPPTITSAPPTATATVGQTYNFDVTTCTTTGAPKIAATGLPKGLALVNNGNGTATISGTPRVKDLSSYSGTITATVKSQTPATQSFTITVDQAAIITSKLKPLVHTGQTITPPIEVVTEDGYPTPALTATGLPSGVTLQDNGDGTGDLVGTPGATSGGTYTVTVSATNVVGVVQKTFTLTDYQAPTLSNVPASQTVTPGTTITPIVVNYAGYPVPSVKAADLPKGLVATVDTTAQTLTISGTPTSKAVSITAELSAKSKAGTATGSIAFTVN
jgi:Big-like domain-containing protein/putative Ig domain-containing protein